MKDGIDGIEKSSSSMGVVGTSVSISGDAVSFVSAGDAGRDEGDVGRIGLEDGC